MKARVALLGAALALAACSKSEVDSTQNAVESAAPKLAQDAVVTTKIEARFVEIDPSSALHVVVNASGGDGNVRLSGTVRSDAVEKKFVLAANGVSGVKHVDSTLAVDAALPNTKQSLTDFALETEVRAKLIEEAGVNGVSLTVTARSGKITLAGTVPSQNVADTLAASAKSVRGVKTVESKLAVHG